jgi:hypothetical protein
MAGYRSSIREVGVERSRSELERGYERMCTAESIVVLSL